MKTNILIGALAFSLLFSCGGAIYYKLQAADYGARWAEAMDRLARTIRSPQPLETTDAPLTVYTPGTNDPSAVGAELNALLLELEQKDRELAELKSHTNRISRTRGFPSAAERQARMEKLMETDPEEYEKQMARREEMRTRIQTAFAERAATLLNRTPSGLSEEEETEREVMLHTLDEIWNLSDQLTSQETEPADRREIMREVFEKSREIRPLLENERERQLYDLGTASGYSEEEAEVFVDYINETLKATSLPMSGRSRGRGR